MGGVERELARLQQEMLEELARREREAARMLASVVLAAGGRVEVSAMDVVSLDSYELIMSNDLLSDKIVLSVRRKQ